MTSFFKDLLFPRHCLGCGALGSFICLTCQGSLRHADKDRCFYCLRQSLYGLTHPVCRRKYGIDGFQTVYRYEKIMKKIMKGIKYRLAKEALEELLSISSQPMVKSLGKIKALYVYLPAGRQVLWVQSVPLHASRLRVRGFNQAEILAHHISTLFSLPLTHNLKRVKKTKPQAQLPSGRERYRNVQAAFIWQSSSQSPSSVLLVDDIVTTGSTIAEAARTLKQQGVKKVFVFSLAKG